MLRVQSEAVEIQGGAPEAAERLPLGRHSALWVQGDCAFLRLAKRKHRPFGSLLRRPCRCDTWGKSLCVVHRLLQVKLVRGVRLFSRSAYERLRDFKLDLAALQTPNAQSYGLRAFRAGCATWLAEKGEPLWSIWQLGEWRSSAFLRYISETEIDRKRFLSAAIENEDDDE